MSDRLLEITWDDRLIEWCDDQKQRFHLLASWEAHPNEHRRTLHTAFELVTSGCLGCDAPISRKLMECKGVSEVFVFRYRLSITKADLFEWCNMMPDIMLAVRDVLVQHSETPVKPEKSTLRTMDDESAKRFEQSLIKYGIYSGSQYGVVPIVYLTWVADNALELQAYLRSERGRRRIEIDSE